MLAARRTQIFCLLPFALLLLCALYVSVRVASKYLGSSRYCLAAPSFSSTSTCPVPQKVTDLTPKAPSPVQPVKS
jgi:hypothetical protein